MNDDQVQVILSAIDKNFSSSMKAAVAALNDVSNANDRMANKSSSSGSTISGSAGRMVNSFTSMASAMGAVAVASKAFDVIKSAVGGAVTRLDTLNNSARTFSNMGFSSGQIKSAMDGLNTGIKGLPTSLDQAVKGTQMLAASTNDLGVGQKVFTAMNDAIIGFGGSTADVQNGVLQLSQALANGKIDAQTWNSMLNSNMGPALNAIARQMGITTGQLKDGLSSGKISVKQFEDALIGLDQNGGGGLKSLHKIALEATSGIGTSMQNAKTAITRGLADALVGINKGLQDNGLPTIAQMIADAGSKMEKALEKVAKAAPKFIAAIAPIIKHLGPLAPVLKAVAVAFVGLGVIAMIAPVLAPVIMVFGSLFAVAKKLSGVLGGAGKGIFNIFKKLSGISGSGKEAGKGLEETSKGAGSAGNSSGRSAGQILALGAAVMMAAIGAAILVASFGYLVGQVTNLAKVGPQGAIAFLAVAAGMAAVIAVMGIVGKMLGAMGPQAALAYAGMALLVGAFALLTVAVTAFAATGTQGLIALAALTAAFVVIIATIAIFGPMLDAAVPGMLAFSLMALAIGAAVAIAALGLSVLVLAFTGLVNALTGLASQGPIAIGLIIAIAAAITIMVAVMAIFGPLLTANAVGLLAFGAALLMAGVGIGIAAAGIAQLVDAIANLLSTNTVAGQIISDIWNAIKWVISNVSGSVGGIVGAGFNAMKGVATGIMNALKGVISGVWNAIKALFSGGVSFMKSVVHVDLGAQGRAIMNSLLQGLKSAWESVKSFVSSIGSWIKDHKGPISYDRKLLIPAGQAIMAGFNRGLMGGFSAVQANVLAMAGAVQDAATLPGLNDSAFARSLSAVQGRMGNLSAGVNGSFGSNVTNSADLQSQLWQSRMEQMMGVAIDKLDNVDQHPVVTVDTLNRMNSYNNKVNADMYSGWRGR